MAHLLHLSGLTSKMERSEQQGKRKKEKKNCPMPSWSGVVHETKPGSEKLQSPRQSGSKIRDGEGGLVSQCSVDGVSMLREVDVSQKMEPSGRQKQA